MHNIVFNEKSFQCRADETVLEALLRQGVEISFSCRKGSCQVCMLECESGDVGSEAQKGLRPVFVKNRYFLPCQCKPLSDLVIREIEHEKIFSPAYVFKKEFLSESVCRLLIETDKITEYKAGQFINMSQPHSGEIRSYSIASQSASDFYIELHIQRMKDGVLSNWIFDELQEQDEIEIQGPNGHCFYQSGNSQRPMLMVATGTGLAPVSGILAEAINKHHTGPIHVYHEVREKSEHYLDAKLIDYSKQHANIEYFPVISSDNPAGVCASRSAHIIQSDYNDLSDWLIYLAGSNHVVSTLHDICKTKGAPENRIFSDAFDYKDLRGSELKQESKKDSNQGSHSSRRITDNNQSYNACHEVEYPAPDLEIWQALNEGTKLTKILNDFYTIVYDDPLLSPFFMNITKQRSVEKVYLFLRQIFSGEKVYIGDRPRNAHHWMVISDELFDYREDIMERCLRQNNMPEHLIKRWRAIEESFRPDIVKSKAWNKVINGVEVPAEGFEELVLDSGTLCDSCQQPVDEGTHVRYHVRLGTVYCPECISVTEETQK